jgi:acyl carrier protein
VENNKEKLYNVVSEILGVKKSDINEKSSQDNIENWDSLAIVNMVTELERAFDVQFDILEIVEFYSIEIIRLILIEKGVKL